MLKAKVKSDKNQLDEPPVKGWQYWVGGNYKSDPRMVCSRQLSPAYTEIIVTLVGAAKEKHPDCAGSYLPVEGKHYRGRPVGFQLIIVTVIVIKIMVSWFLGHGATKSKIGPTWWISGTNSVLISGFILQLPRNKIVFCMIIQTAYYAVVDDDTDDWIHDNDDEEE